MVRVWTTGSAGVLSYSVTNLFYYGSSVTVLADSLPSFYIKKSVVFALRVQGAFRVFSYIRDSNRWEPLESVHVSAAVAQPQLFIMHLQFHTVSLYYSLCSVLRPLRNLVDVFQLYHRAICQFCTVRQYAIEVCTVHYYAKSLGFPGVRHAQIYSVFCEVSRGNGC